MTTTKYVIQNDNGEFYWKSDVSAMWGFYSDFSSAYLFRDWIEASQRMRTLTQQCSIRKVELKLVEE